jgi:Mg2+/Co2+ transporter CorB
MDLNLLNALTFLICLLVSFLLSGMEAGVFALNRLRIRRLARSGKNSARILNRFLESPERFLWTILVGNTLANFFILGWALAKLHEWFTGQPAVTVALFAVVVFLFYAVFDLLPKMLFRIEPAGLAGGKRLAGHFARQRGTIDPPPAVWQPRGIARGHAGIRPRA